LNGWFSYPALRFQVKGAATVGSVQALTRKRLASVKRVTDYFLTEIRSIVKTKEDVAQLWLNCRPEDIKILGLDLGQACIVGASALLLDVARPVSNVKMKDRSDMNIDVAIKGSYGALTALSLICLLYMLLNL
jgi:hypothetical protein